MTPTQSSFWWLGVALFNQQSAQHLDGVAGTVATGAAVVCLLLSAAFSVRASNERAGVAR